MRTRPSVIGALLFGSGFCALVYQLAWTRELRLVFGASTAASAAVLAIFMGGLGAGGALLGRRADRHPRPLALYASLELLVAASAAVTPGLVFLARLVYARLGGTVVLGMAGGTVVRLLLATLVIGAPALLMGGTLPAAARAAETQDDAGRRRLAVLYGANTLGAVVGAALSTFVLLEVFGARLTLWLACLVNALVGVLARSLSREAPPAPDEIPAAEAAAPAAPPRFVLAAACLVGFAFLLLELVWYRMLAPLLGGSSYTFGLILAVALLGIGAGGAAYAIFGGDRPASLRGFAVTAALEAVLVAAPFALGDRIALLALLLRPWGAVGFAGHVAAWTIVAGVVVLPAAFVSGVQFPQLIALLGRGGHGVGRHTGLAYAWNTAGAIAGSLAGGFGLLPLLSAPGAWRLAAALLAALAIAAGALDLRAARAPAGLVAPALAAISLSLLTAAGPTAAWRHSPIGAGRADHVAHEASRNTLREWMNAQRRAVAWEADGREASVALSTADGAAFIVNGKGDGHARHDAQTQVMSGLIVALLHPDPRRALVVGLGTGSTAGWLGAAPSIERVDVVELEPAILRVARDSAAVNHGALDNPRIHVLPGDAREVLSTTPLRYDVIFSEPSNPYRVGVSSLFTQDFYRAVAERLAPGGVFAQWVQAYEIDGRSLRVAYTTLASVFPHVETWQTKKNDLLLVASRAPIAHDAAALRARLAAEPYRSALASVFRAETLEGLLAHHLARPSFARAVAEREGPGGINTDDANLLEFALARTVGRRKLVSVDEVRSLARARREDRPEITGDVRWDAVEEHRLAMYVVDGRPPPAPPPENAAAASRHEALTRWANGDVRGALAAWRAQPEAPATLVEVELVAEGLADAGVEGDEQARLFEVIRARWPAEALALSARLHARRGRLAPAAEALAQAFLAYRADPWPAPPLMRRAIALAIELGRADRAIAAQLHEALAEPFAVSLLQEVRLSARVDLALAFDARRKCAAAFAPFEPFVPWQRAFLVRRAACYRAAGDPYAGRAEEDLASFLEDEGSPFGEDARVPD
jgi:spermidine synthase